MGGIKFGGVSSGIAFFGARNGLSMSANRAVLGQDLADATNPADLLSSREIRIANFPIILYQDAAKTQYTRLGVFPGNNAFFGLILNGASGLKQPLIHFTDNASLITPVYYLTVLANEFVINDSVGQFFRMSRVFSSMSAPLQCYQSVVDYAINTAITILNDRSRRVITNRGAAGNVVYTLPAIGVILYQEYTIIQQNVNTITLTAPAGATIRIGAVVSPVAGTVTSTAIGCSVRLQIISATEYVAIAVVGVWVTP